MNYKEFETAAELGVMSLDATYWIVDYRFDDINNKAIRNVTPTEVKVFDMDQDPSSKRVYYSQYYFKPVGSSGKTLAKIIAPYDNTGYRGFTGIGVNVFKTEEEARAFYCGQCDTVLEQIKVAQDENNRRFNSMMKAVIETKLAKG